MGNIRKSYTVRDKLKIITYAEAHGNRAAILLDFGANKKRDFRKYCVARWEREEKPLNFQTLKLSL